MHSVTESDAWSDLGYGYYDSAESEAAGFDVDLTPDMSRVWGQVIRGLRESGENMLYAAIADLSTVDYTNDTIEITCKDDSLFNLLTKHKAKLEKFAGAGAVSIFRQSKPEHKNKDTITRLESLFGARLTIQKNSR